MSPQAEPITSARLQLSWHRSWHRSLLRAAGLHRGGPVIPWQFPQRLHHRHPRHRLPQSSTVEGSCVAASLAARVLVRPLELHRVIPHFPLSARCRYRQSRRTCRRTTPGRYRIGDCFAGILKEHEAGRKIAELAREHGVSEATLYGWKSKYGGMEVGEAKTAEESGRREPPFEAVGSRSQLGQRSAEGDRAKNGWSLPA
jgi:putative transposase